MNKLHNEVNYKTDAPFSKETIKETFIQLDESRVETIKGIIEVVKRFTDTKELMDDIETCDITGTYTTDKEHDHHDGVSEHHNNLVETIEFDTDTLCCKMYYHTILNTLNEITIENTSFIFNKNIKGKSNSLLFFSEDFRYCFKIIRKNEFIKLAHEIGRITNYMDKNPNTFLTKYLGLFSISERSMDAEETFIVVMKNVLDRKYPKIYDLKGLGVTRGENEGIRIQLDQRLKVKKNTIRQLKKDIDFLSNLGVMDYSIVIGRNKTSYSIGIVDTLTTYTFYKKMERMYSIIFCEASGSSTNPQEYAERIKKQVDCGFEE